MKKKNADYGGDDVMGNLRLIEQLYPGDTVEKGIVIRMGDKLSRLAVLTRQDAQVVDEKIDDTCCDLINYAILLLAAHSLRTPTQTIPQTESPHQKREPGYPPGWYETPSPRPTP